MLRTAELLPPTGFRRWASTRPVSRPSRQPTTEPPGSYSDGTLTRWRRRAYVGSGLHQPPPTLGAHEIRATVELGFVVQRVGDAGAHREVADLDMAVLAHALVGQHPGLDELVDLGNEEGLLLHGEVGGQLVAAVANRRRTPRNLRARRRVD